jgi:CBS domain-containing protein
MNAVVRDVMTPDVITVCKDTSFEVIAAALREHRVSAFPVLDEATSSPAPRLTELDRPPAPKGPRHGGPNGKHLH